MSHLSLAVFQDFLFGLGILQFDYNAAKSGLVRVQPISNLEIIQLLGFVDTCTSSNLGSFSHFLLQIVSLPLFLLFFGDSHNTYIGPLMLSYKSPRFYSLFFILFSLLFRLNHFSCTFFRLTASFFRLFSIAHHRQQTRRLGCSKLSSLPGKHQEQNQKLETALT